MIQATDEPFRHSNLTDMSMRDLHNVAENYIDVAKVGLFNSIIIFTLEI